MHDQSIPIYSVSHRRGTGDKAAVHKSISTCGTTLPGSALRVTFEDDEDRATRMDDADCILERKCPRVLNDATLAQPCIDRHNRYRQHILAMEKRLQTDRFEFRFGTSMQGIIFVDSFFAYRHFNNPLADFRAELGRLAYKLMHNPDLQPKATPSPPPKKAQRASPGSGGSACSEDGTTHTLIKIRSIQGYSGGKDGRQKCMICNKKTTWCCAACSDGALQLFPLCPHQTNYKGDICARGCLEKHWENPACMPKGRSKTGGAKRRKAGDSAGVDAEPGSSSDESEE